MKTKTLLTMVFVLLATMSHPVCAETKVNKPLASQSPAKELVNYKNPEYNKYEGYSVDGFTSASKLAAQRSHTVAGEDERNFAVFTGVVVILIVVCFSQIVFNKK